jgi:uncharacterized membrane protein YdbT with pleckstrin-like domain
MRVKSKIDFWVGILIWSVIVIMVGTMTKLNDQTAISYVIGLPLIALLLWIYFGTYYELRDEYLYCRCGPFTEKIEYLKIRSVKLSENMLSSMALSGDRIEIKQHGRGYLLGTTFISPENREQFMSELTSRCKNLSP